MFKIDYDGVTSYLLYEVEDNFEPFIIELGEVGYLVFDVDVSDEDVLAGIREVFSEFTPAQCEELLSDGKVAFQDTLICTC